MVFTGWARERKNKSPECAGKVRFPGSRVDGMDRPLVPSHTRSDLDRVGNTKVAQWISQRHRDRPAFSGVPPTAPVDGWHLPPPAWHGSDGADFGLASIR